MFYEINYYSRTSTCAAVFHLFYNIHHSTIKTVFIFFNTETYVPFDIKKTTIILFKFLKTHYKNLFMCFYLLCSCQCLSLFIKMNINGYLKKIVLLNLSVIMTNKCSSFYCNRYINFYYKFVL